MQPFERVFLDDIIANPADDTPRLVYADWLDENGREARGEFIRVQVGIAQICRANRDGIYQDAHTLDDLISRESVLMSGVWDLHWLDPLPYQWISDSVVSRGFLTVAACPLTTWSNLGERICGLHPVEGVRPIGMLASHTYRSHQLAVDVPPLRFSINFHDNGLADLREIESVGNIDGYLVRAIIEECVRTARDGLGQCPPTGKINEAVSRGALLWAKLKAGVPLAPPPPALLTSPR